jgi:hypothetical protein
MVSWDMAAQDIDNARKTLADTIRQHVHNQVGYWRQLPRLAIEGEGRTGYLGDAEYVYGYNVLPIPYGPGGYGRVAINCNNGDLLWITNDSGNLAFLPARDDMILSLLPESIDGAVTLAKFQERAAQPYFNSHDVAQVEQWRREIWKMHHPEPLQEFMDYILAERARKATCSADPLAAKQ